MEYGALSVFDAWESRAIGVKCCVGRCFKQQGKKAAGGSFQDAEMQDAEQRCSTASETVNSFGFKDWYVMRRGAAGLEREANGKQMDQDLVAEPQRRARLETRRQVH